MLACSFVLSFLTSKMPCFNSYCPICIHYKEPNDAGHRQAPLLHVNTYP